MKKVKTSESVLIGRTDKADFPDYDLHKLTVKIDSGAFTSAIHCCKIEKVDADRLEVIFLDELDPKYTGKVHQFRSFEQKRVRSSNGISEERFIVDAKIKLGKLIYDIQLSLTFRGDMRSPVLIGRRFLSNNRFIVNPRLVNRLYRNSLKD